MSLRLGAVVVSVALGISAATVQHAGAEPAEPQLVNVALESRGATVSASGNERPQWPAENAIDGDLSSRWSSNTSDDAWIAVELAEAAHLHHVTFQWETACPARYKLQVSKNGTEYVDASDVRTPQCPGSNVAGPEQVNLNEATAGEDWKFVRMQGVERTPFGGVKYGMSMYEFEVWVESDEAPPPPAPELGLVPLPASVTARQGDPFVLRSTTRLVATGAAKRVAELFAQELNAATGWQLPVVEDPEQETIHFVLDGEFDPGIDTPAIADAYELDVDKAKVTITARAEEGLFYGVQTLKQLLPPAVHAQQPVTARWEVTPVGIKDAPRFAHRSVQADVARSFLTVAELKQQIDTMSVFKQNRLHLHLADDQGWRIEITNEGKAADDPVDYSKLTEVSGQSAMLVHSENYQREFGRHGFYTQDDYREIVRYAQERYITVIPEIDVPGHTNALLHAVPELNSEHSLPRPTKYGTVAEQNDGGVGRSALDVTNEQTWVSLRHIFTQLRDLTPGPYIHIGGDETHSMNHQHFKQFVARATRMVHDLGKKTMGWNEYAEADLLPGDIVHYWVGDTRFTKEAVEKKGAKVVISTARNSYLDQKYGPEKPGGPNTPIGLTWAGQGDVDAYYNWDPARVIPGVGDDKIVGVEAPTWSESIRGGYQNEFLVFPRAISHAEVGWTKQSQRKTPSFLKRMADVGARLQFLGTNFYDGPKVAWERSLAGLPGAAGITEARVEVGLLAAPRTTLSDDGTQVQPVGSTDAITAIIDFGDGSAEVPAVFATEYPRTPVRATSLYSVGADHTYPRPGSYTATVRLSDGSRAQAEIVVVAGQGRQAAGFVYDACAVPKSTVKAIRPAEGTNGTRDDARVVVSVQGMQPEQFLNVTWDGTDVGNLLSGKNGTVELSHYVSYGTEEGEHLLRITSPDGKFVEHVVDVRSGVARPVGEPVAGVRATASSEALNETAPNGRASAAVDGNPETFWHSQWSQPVAQFPHWLAFDLGAETDLSSVHWLPRQANTNGRIKLIDIEVSSDGSTWTKAKAGVTLNDGAAGTLIEFPQRARHVRLMLREPQASGSPFATAAEVVFRKAPENPDAPPEKLIAKEWKPGANCPAQGEPKPGEPKPGEPKPSEPKPSEPKPSEPKPS
ncbi:family 20 glycosylhydrolase, partial [Tessaracoccus sp. OH4464_COT-324]|uniref:family 20 glycosylhydrolase n=1 Tax=Tessaracoccus sp. OH4464_COT-324 TaxID=2491059 RepID=UPI000F935359